MTRVETPRWLGWAALVLAGAVLVAHYVRLYFGVDFTDEAFYAANCRGLVNGVNPLVDEAAVVQHGPCLMAYPFAWSFDELRGGDGVILFYRHLHFVLTLVTFGVVFAALRRVFGSAAWVAVLAAVSAAFVPFNIPSFSYNSIGASMFFAGSCCVLAAVATRSARWAAAGSFLNGVAVFAYPPLLIPVVLQAAVAAWFTRRRDLIVALALPLGLWCLAFVALVLSAGLDDVRQAANDSTEYLGQSGGIDKVEAIIRTVWNQFSYRYLAALILVAAWLLRRRVPLAAAGLLLIAPLAALPEIDSLRVEEASLFFVRSYSVMSGALYLFVRHDPVARQVFRIVWLPAIVAGLVTAMSSAAGPVNFAIGSFPAVLAGIVFTGIACRELLGERETLRPVVVLAAGALVVCALTGLQFTASYRDRPPPRLTATVSEGPYAGIRTSKVKRDFIEATARTVDASVRNGDSILFFDDFPAGYLFTDAPRATNAIWLAKLVDIRGRKIVGYREILLDYLATHRPPDVALQLRRAPIQPKVQEIEYARRDPIFALLARDYRAPVQAGDFAVYRRR